MQLMLTPEINTLVYISIVRIGTIYEDVTSDVLGQIGPWQWLMTFMSTTFMVTNLFTFSEDLPLLRPSYDIVSIPPEKYETYNTTLCQFHNGTENLKHYMWQIKLMGILSVTRSWIVFCEKKQQLLSMAIISRLGSAFGFVIFGIVADSFGRRKALLLSIITEVPVNMIISFCDSEGWFRLLVFLRPLFGGALVYMGLIVTCEIASNVWRSRLMIIPALPRIIALVYMVPLANSIPNLETFGFVACLYSGILIILLRWIPESPHWCLYNRKITTAEKTLFAAAKRNKVKLCTDFKIRPVNPRAYECLEEPLTCIGIITTYNIRVTALVTLLLWSCFEFLWSCLYLSVFIKSPSKNIIVVLLFSTSIIGCLTIFSSQKLLLRHMLLLNVSLAGALTVVLILIMEESNHLRTVISTVAISCGLMGHLIILNITPRIFAINMRATMLGSCLAVGQLGSIVGYLIVFLNAVADDVLAVIIFVFTLALSAICLLIPDVDGRELPDILEDMDYFMELSKPLRWVSQKTNSTSLEEVQMRVYSFSRNYSTDTSILSPERPPPRPIGLRRHWHRLVNYLRPKMFKI